MFSKKEKKIESCENYNCTQCTLNYLSYYNIEQSSVLLQVRFNFALRHCLNLPKPVVCLLKEEAVCPAVEVEVCHKVESMHLQQLHQIQQQLSEVFIVFHFGQLTAVYWNVVLLLELYLKNAVLLPELFIEMSPSYLSRILKSHPLT